MHAHTDTLLKVGRVGLGGSEIAQWVEVLATKPEKLSSTPRTDTVKESIPTSCPLHMPPTKINEQRNVFYFLSL